MKAIEVNMVAVGIGVSAGTSGVTIVNVACVGSGAGIGEGGTALAAGGDNVPDELQASAAIKKSRNITSK